MAVKKKIIRLKNNQNTKREIFPSSPKTVAELKRKYRFLPLHFLFGVDKSIEFQCPILDDYINQIMEVKETLEMIRRCKSLEKAKVHAAYGLHALQDISDDIDKITRGNFEQIRKTGEGWKQLAIEAINETQNPEKFLKI